MMSIKAFCFGGVNSYFTRMTLSANTRTPNRSAADAWGTTNTSAAQLRGRSLSGLNPTQVGFEGLEVPFDIYIYIYIVGASFADWICWI